MNRRWIALHAKRIQHSVGYSSRKYDASVHVSRICSGTQLHYRSRCSNVMNRNSHSCVESLSLLIEILCSTSHTMYSLIVSHNSTHGIWRGKHTLKSCSMFKSSEMIRLFQFPVRSRRPKVGKSTSK